MRKNINLFKRRGKFLIESIRHITNSKDINTKVELEKFKKLKSIEYADNIIYKKNNKIKRQLAEEFYMSILACDRIETNLTLTDLMIKFRDLVDKDLKNHFNLVIYNKLKSVGNGMSDNSNNETHKLYFEAVIESQELTKHFNIIKEKIDRLIMLSNTSSRITKKDTYNGLIKKKDLYNKIMNEIDILEEFLNEMATKFKNTIHSLMPFVIYLDNVKKSLLKLDKLNNDNLHKLNKRYGILLNKDEVTLICKLFTNSKIFLGANTLNKIRNIMPPDMRKFLKKYITKFQKKRKDKKIPIHIDKNASKEIRNEILNSKN